MKPVIPEARRLFMVPHRPFRNRLVTVRMQVCLRRHQLCRHNRDEGARQEKRGDHREHHRHRQRLKEGPGRSAQKQDRKENNADCEGAYKLSRADLLDAVHDRAVHLLSLAQVPIDVLNRDNRIVNQNSNR